MSSLGVLLVGAAPLLACAREPSGGEQRQGEAYTFTLYRTSVDHDEVRIHVATFDATEDDSDAKNAEYNRNNCDVARGLFQDQPHVKTRFFCEKGFVRK